MRKTHLMLLAAAALLAPSAGSAQGPMCDLFPCPSKSQVAKAVKAAQAFPLGSAKNPVRSDMPPGERAYLSRLRCSDGSTPGFDRGGSVGEGPFGGIMDVYSVRCASGQPADATVYMDMYHSGYEEDQAVPGFTIAPR